MAKCYNCGKNFDYDKYYGICPKCSAYNREKLPEEEHQEFHEEYDQMKECSNLSSQENQSRYEYVPQGENQNPYGSTQQREDQSGYGYVPLEEKKITYGYVSLEDNRNTYGQMPAGARPKSSNASIVVFILLILGIVVTIAMPMIYMGVKSMELGMRVANDTAEIASEWNGDNRAYLDDYEDEYPLQEEEVEQPRQSVETVTAEIQKTCILGKSRALMVTVVEQPYVKIPAGQVEGFPAGEKLVAIPVSYSDDSDAYTSYSGLGVVYAGYGDHIFKSVLSPYDLEGYTLELDMTEVVNSYSIIGESGRGEFMIFVPEEVTEISLYLESRDEDTNQMIGLYEIPLEIQTESGADAEDGEVQE